MQLDEFTAKRKYIKVTCQKTIDKQDQDFLRIDASITQWAHPDIEYQYLLQNLVMDFKYDSVFDSKFLDIAKIKIRNNHKSYKTEESYVEFLKEKGERDYFMA